MVNLSQIPTLIKLQKCCCLPLTLWQQLSWHLNHMLLTDSPGLALFTFNIQSLSSLKTPNIVTEYVTLMLFFTGICWQQVYFFNF